MNDNPLNRFDKIGMFRLIADKIERDPALLQIALGNIARWIAKGADQQHRLRQWEGMIRQAQASKSGMEVLLAALREDSEQAAQLREFAPFDGVLTTMERRPYILQCAFQH
ncbi:MAG: hypothetical protein WCS31_01495 [Verrucomicrobiae bacterium]